MGKMTRGVAMLPARLAEFLPPLLGTVFFAMVAWQLKRPVSAVRTAHREPAPAQRTAGIRTIIPVPGSNPRPLSMPIAGIDPRSIRDSFDEGRGSARHHEALDIPAPRSTPVLAVDDGVVRKLFTSVPGGLTVYQYDPNELYCYYYAHLDGYAEGLHEGQAVRRGDRIGYVGTTGNAPKDAPHLHLAVYRLEADKRWWTGTPIDPYPLLVGKGE